MTMLAAERELPLRVDILTGEGLDSWLEALARRNGLSTGRLLPALGWQAPHTAIGLLLNIAPPVLRRIERQTGLPPGRLDNAVLDHYLRLGPVRRDGSRYCPRCLAERDGRWLLTWRLPWVFACPRHRILLCDTCPGCGKPPRGCAGAGAGRTPPGSCPNPVNRNTWCGADLRTVPTRRLTPGGRLLMAQQWISTVLATADSSTVGPSGDTTAAQVLTDLNIVAGWLLRQSPPHIFASFGPRICDAWHARAAQPATHASTPGCAAPADAGLAGAAATQAMALLTGDDSDAIARIRPLLRHHPGHWPVRPAGLTTRQWAHLSTLVQRRFLRALDPALPPVDRIRYRSGTPLARLPADAAGVLATRARHIPQLLWPDWTIRMLPAEGFLPGPFRAALAACLLLPGNPARTLGEVTTGLHAYRKPIATGRIVRALAAAGHEGALAAISCIADYLDTHGSPIDYQHRRDTITPAILSKPEWQDLCYQARAHPGEDRRLLDARRYLCQLLTGDDLDDPRHPLMFRSVSDRDSHLTFTDTLTTALRATLHEHAARYLDSLGIAEPLTWQPPPCCSTGLTLPGRDPADIDLHAVHQLITQGLPIGAAAERLATSTTHIRLTLEHIPRPQRPWGRNAPPVVRDRREQARRLLTRDFFQREYLTAGKTLSQLETETGFSRAWLARYAHQHSIPLTSATTPTPIDPTWLREQYLTRRRSYTSIAAELGVRDVTVIAAAHRHGIPSRPPGVHSRPEMITRLSADTPRDIRRAVEGGLKGWHRLHRFQTAMSFPTIQAAATHLGAHQSALVHQFRRLEHDIGAKLYHPSAPHQPMRPTARGAALLKALALPEICDLARNTGQ